MNNFMVQKFWLTAGLALLMVGCGTQPQVQQVEVTRTILETVNVDGEPMARLYTSGMPAMEAIIEEPSENNFQDYGTNPLVDAQQDNLSTFAIDVDTGAYTVMRNYINEGSLPPAEAVRVEEFVNFFKQDYAKPANGAFAIHVEGAPSPYSGEQAEYQMVRVGIQGYEVDPAQRPDAMLIFVIDVSGSMDQPNRLGLVKESLNKLLDNLRPTDRVGIVVYGSTGRVLLEPTSVDSRQTIQNAINQLQSEGSTNAEEGLRLAYDLATQYAIENGINRIILCSDGAANVGQTTSDAILQHAKEGIQLSTFGFGMGGYNDVLMESLADQGDGSYAYIDTAEEADRVFGTQLTTTLLTIAKEAKIQVEFNPAVVANYRLLGYENRDIADQDFENDQVDAGEIGAGHSVTALYEVQFTPQASDNDVALTVRVRYADPETNEVTELEQSMTKAQFLAAFTDASPRFQLSAVVAEYAEILRDSTWAGDNELADLVVDAQRIAEYLPQDEDVQEFAELVKLAAGMQK